MGEGFLARWPCFLGVFFLEKNGFLTQKTFSVKRKNGSFSVNSAGTSSIVIMVHFFMARTVPPKLRVLILAIGDWPEMAQNRGEPRKMTHTSETEFFLGVDPMGKL